MAAIRAGRLDVLVLLGHKRQRIGLGAADGRWMSEAVFAAWASRERSDKSGRQTLSHGRDRVRYVPFRPQWRILGVDNLGELKAARTTRRNMLLRGNRLPLGDQESVGCDAQRGVVVEAAPSTALEVAEPDLLLEFLIVTFDTPPQLCEVDQALQSDALRKGREPVFCRRALAVGPLDQQPFFRPGLAAFDVVARNANTHASKARGQTFGRAFAPFNPVPSPLG